MGLRVGFTGTRGGMTAAQKTALRQVLEGLQMDVIHHGDCIGADAEFHDMASEVGGLTLTRIIHPGNVPSLRANCKGEQSYPPTHFHPRNRDIVACSDLVIAAPAAMFEQPIGGTWYTIRYARSQRKPLIIVWPDGSILRHQVSQGA